MVFDDFLDDVKPEPGAAFGLLGVEIRIEDSGKLRRLNSSGGIFDSKIHIEIFLLPATASGRLPKFRFAICGLRFEALGKSLPDFSRI